MKKCSKCLLDKDESSFSKKRNGLQPFCKECNNEYHRQHYRNNKKSYFEKAKRNDEKYHNVNIGRRLDYFLEHPCVDCGESNPLVLDFDHRDRTTKLNNVSTMIHSKRVNWSSVMTEIEKCDVRCANCHRIKTLSGGKMDMMIKERLKKKIINEYDCGFESRR